MDRRLLIAGGLASAMLPFATWAQRGPVEDPTPDPNEPNDPPATVPGRLPDTLAPEDLARVKARLASYFDLVVAASKNSPPPGVNAANGWFRKAMRDDPDMAMARRRIEVDSVGGNMCAAAANMFMDSCYAAFEPDNHFASGLTYFPLTAQVLHDCWPQLAILVASIIGVIASGGAGAAEVAEIQKETQAVLDAVSGSGNQSSGTHANGYISQNLHNSVPGLTRYFGSGRPRLSADGRDFMDILLTSADCMATLPTDNMDPWLNAQWQIGFQAICAATSKALKQPA